jgi:hypothetical protein
MEILKIEEVYRVTFEDGTVVFVEKVVPADGGEKPDPDDVPDDGGDEPLWEWAVTSQELVVREVPSLTGTVVYTAVKDTVFQVKPQTVDGDLWVWRETRSGHWIQEYNLMTDERVLSIGIPDDGVDDFPDEPDDEREWFYVASSNVNTRVGPNTSGTPIVLAGGRQVFATKVDPSVAGYDTKWEWYKIGMTNGDTETYEGRFVARQSADGKTVFLKIQDLPDPKAFSPSLYPVVEKFYDGLASLNAILDGNNPRRQTGANGRRFMWMLDGDGAVRDSQFLETGADRTRLIEELDRLNKPNWTHEPLYGHLIRVYVKNNEFDTAQTIKNGHAFMKLIDTYRGNGLPYIRVVFCMVDTFNAYPNMVFPEYVKDYHTGPDGKTNSKFWIDRAWESAYMELVEAFVPAMSDAYPDLIFGWQIMNEAAVTEPATVAAIEAFIEGNQAIAHRIWELSGGRHHIMTGWRTAADIYQDAMSAEAFYDLLLNADGNAITCINNHPYIKEPPLANDWMTNPYSLFEDWDKMLADIVAGRKHKRLYVADEFGSRCDGWPAWHVGRDVVDKHALEYLQWRMMAYAVMAWALALTGTFDQGFGDDRGLTRYKSINGVQHEYGSTPGAAGALSKHGQDNYGRG